MDYILITIAGLLLAVGGLLYTNSHNHYQSCNSPCTVHFKEPMAEDDFQIDYINGTLRVWKSDH